MPAVIRSTRRLPSTAALLTAVAALGAGCTGGGDESVPTVTPTATVAQLAEVPAEEFSMAGYGHDDSYAFDFSTGGEVVGLCVSDGRGATCTGDPRAVSVDATGVSYTELEGVPPAPRWLEPGETVTFGDATCAAPDAETLSCTTEVASLTVTGPERRIVTTGPVAQR